MSRQVGVPYQCADAQPTRVGHFNLIEPEPVHIDKVGGRFNFQLHQVQQIGPARDKFCAGYALSAKCRLGWGIHSFIGKRLHDFISPAASSMAARMLAYAPQRQMLPLIRSRISSAVVSGAETKSTVT